jgi:hypothetical protein
LFDLNRERLLQRPVEHRLAGAVVKIGDEHAVLLGERGRAGA